MTFVGAKLLRFTKFQARFTAMANSSLQFVDFMNSGGKPATGLAAVRRPNAMDLNIDEQAAVFAAESFQNIDFIFFRRFADGRSSQMAAYVVDNSDQRLDERALAELHRQVWLQGTVPLLYVAWPSRIDVLTCARGPDFWKAANEECRYNPAKIFAAEALQVAGEINQELQKFSARRLADGTFWDEPSNAELADYNKAAHQSLIQAVVEADGELDGAANPTQRRLLLLMILIKYLEDRGVFPNDGWFGGFRKGARNFFDVLRGGNPEEIYRLLDKLERKFNGDIFAPARAGRDKLTKKNLEAFADLVEARTLHRQRYLWEQFSFKHLPVEIISHLYQRFVHGGHGAVYTPPFLAALLLDHALPYDRLTGEERVLDPACGSGVFLVGAFRRLINFWRSRNGWQRPEVAALQKISRRSIYGIELDADAVDLTAFSLSLALCDALQPEVIWRDLKFDRLREANLFETDFFQLLQNAPTMFKGKFDVVIGNPPFESKLSAAGIEVDKAAQQQDKNRGALPDQQTAYLFLEQAFNLLASGGRVCLIQPSGLIYNRNAQAFRTTLLEKHRVDTILDFTSIRNLYEADPKTIAVFAHVEAPPDKHLIEHWTFRRTASVHERLGFELDHYDRHRILQQEAETDPYVWRANLLGGGRLLHVSQWLRRFSTLEKYLEKKKQEGWDYGEGFIVGRSGKSSATFLTGKPTLPTEAFSASGIDESKITLLQDTEFVSPRKEERYTPPLVLIKELGSLPVAFWDKGFLSYRHRIVGIHAPPSQVHELRALYDSLLGNHITYQFCCALHSTELLVDKATTIRKQDIDILPYPENRRDLRLAFWEEALCEDVLQLMTEYIRLGQNSVLLKAAAGIDDLRKYSGLFVRMLGTIYRNLKAAEPVFLDGLICQPFYFGERPKLGWLEEQNAEELRKLIYDDRKHARLRTIRLLRFYSENVALLVKPDRLRYWIRSTAIRDADETLVDLWRQGY